MKIIVAFVDWNAQIINHSSQHLEPLKCAECTLERTARTIERVLLDWPGADRFRVTMRLYHGWHKGFAPTPNRIAITKTVAQVDFSCLARSNRVAFSSDVQYGDRLLDAINTRLHPRLGIHLPNTLRTQRKGEPPVEKMVDTAIASDLLSWARTSYDEHALVLSEDDDLVPAIYVAEAWLQSTKRTVRLIRLRHQSTACLNLHGLI